MDPILDLWADADVRRDLIATAVLLAAVIGVRLAALRGVRSFMPSERDVLRLRWSAYAKTATWIVFVFGAIVIWASELQSFALSLVAFAVAIVLATKELLLCVSGSILRTSARAFAVGDRIEVGGVRGDVIDHGLLATTILEIGPSHARTGRAVTLPNSVFLDTAIVNETQTDEYVLHTIRVPFPRTGPWHAAEKVLLEAATEVCGEHRVRAARHLDALASQHGVGSVSTDPRVFIVLERDDALTLVLRVPTPARDKGRVEQAILRRFLDADLGRRD